MSIRVHELAKKLGMENKDLISLLKARNYDVKTSSSTVDNISAAALELEFPNAAAAAPAPNAAPAPAVAVPTVDWAKPHSKGPVGPMVKSADDVVRERSETAARLAADAQSSSPTSPPPSAPAIAPAPPPPPCPSCS
jgi:translation initiation factor IF-2